MNRKTTGPRSRVVETTSSGLEIREMLPGPLATVTGTVRQVQRPPRDWRRDYSAPGYEHRQPRPFASHVTAECMARYIAQGGPPTTFRLELARARDGHREIHFHILADNPDKRLLSVGAKVRVSFDSWTSLRGGVQAVRIRKAAS
jgi:hypothetical protein